MKTKMVFRIQTIWFLCLFSLVFFVGGANAGEIATVTIYSTSDIHDHSDNLARVAQFIKERKSENPNVLFLDAGDRFDYGQVPIMYTRGEAIYAMMSNCGYDAGVLGNHAGSFGTKRLVELLNRFRFPLLAANCVWPEDMKPNNVASYKIFELEGVKVAVIGVSAPWMNHISDTLLTRTDPNEAIRRLVPELRKQADIIVAITHCGADRDMKLARSVPGIDVIIGGHNHRCFGEILLDTEAKTMITQPSDFGAGVGEVVIRWDGEKIVDRRARYIEIGKDIPEDPHVKALRAKYINALDMPLVRIPSEMTSEDMTLWLSEAIRKNLGVDIVLTQKSFCPVLQQGQLTPQRMLERIPRFEIMRFSVSGQDELTLLLEHIRKKVPDIISYGKVEPSDKPNIRIAYPCVKFDKLPNLEEVGLDSPVISQLERVHDRSLWQIVVEEVRKGKRLAVPLLMYE